LDGSIFIDGGLDGKLGNLFDKTVDFPIFQFTGNIFTVSRAQASQTRI
jgi:hypothetical protein